MSLLLSAQTGEQITPEQLLGTEKEALAEKTAEAERAAKKLLRKMKKAGLRT